MCYDKDTQKYGGISPSALDLSRKMLYNKIIEKQICEVIKMAKDKRFEKIYSQNAGSTVILLDKETGVQYLFHSTGYSGGLTPLLDREGKPVIAPIQGEAQEF